MASAIEITQDGRIGIKVDPLAGVDDKVEAAKTFEAAKAALFRNGKPLYGESCTKRRKRRCSGS